MEQHAFTYHNLATSSDLDVLMEAIGEKRIVLLGEASHGTSEYYTWRAAISKRLIQEKGFNFIAVEGDWPDCYHVNRFVKGYSGAPETAKEVLQAFERWPTWMWGNWEIAALADWLKQHNHNQPNKQKVGFYGLDVYSLYESLEEILRYLQETDSPSVAAAKRAFNCFAPYHEDPQQYAVSAAFSPSHCEEEVVKLLQQLTRKPNTYAADPEEAFNAEQNALVAVNAERYYRAMVRGGSGSWNVRDRHMMETLNRLLDHHGPNSKAIVWEHNTHIGDARATSMARSGMVNVGQLSREEHGRENCFLVGFGSYEGTVIAASEWGAQMQEMHVPKAPAGTWEASLHATGAHGLLLLSSEIRKLKSANEVIGHRAIGVVYDPKMERLGNYVPSVIPERYDSFLFFDKTRALHPLKMRHTNTTAPELYPWNV